MRNFILIGIIIVVALFALMLRQRWTGLHLSVCEYVCDRRGRELASVSPGMILVKCNCGKLKKVPPDLKRP